MNNLTVSDVQQALNLDICAGEIGLNRPVSQSGIYRPGLEMAGYFNYFPARRIQLLGKTELTFFSNLTKEERVDRIQKLCSDVTPAIIVAHKMEPPAELIEQANLVGIPILKTDIATSKIFVMLINYLEGQLAPMVTMHGVLVDVYGIGVLITGKSGVGKSETALELIKRGHRLIADDSVEIREVSTNVLIGSSPKLIEHMLEIRGIGIIDIVNLFGASAVKSDKRVLLVIDLELWDESKVYDRLGLDENKIKIMDTELTKLVVPVRPGRNLSVIIEVAAMDYRMKQLGYNAAEEFSTKLEAAIETEQNTQQDKEKN